LDVPICTNCGRESSGDFAFCPYCGAQLASRRTARELRKTVTVLFSDVVGSTSLGGSVDPEAFRAILARYFERTRAIIEAHGGTVEKFVGDAVMAVFGVPTLHEDDPLRAVRAAAEIMKALPDLGVQARVGVNTGEVVTSTGESLATGDAVNVAARLEQAAAPGEVLLGVETVRRARDAIDAEPVGPLELKGKSEPVAAYRLLAVQEFAERRRLETPLVGRQEELLQLGDAFARARDQRSCQLVTVVGPAGVGKSRLASEFASGIDARVLRGHCVSYGEGITYWPVVEVVKQLGPLPPEDPAATPLRSLLGESDAGTSTDEIAWAFRKLLERNAREQPLVCILDDLHWGEETFLDLVEHVTDLARDAPILVLSMARPELLDRRPSWGRGKQNATTVHLEPLHPAQTDQLLDALGGVEGDLRERVVLAAEGNPLFLEEMVALVHESGDKVSVPPTIHALLAARLDQLDPADRSVLERGAVGGRTFHRSAVQALSEPESQLTGRLVSLVGKGLLQSEPTQLADDEAYRFRHVLIRDATYGAVPKTVRADLHQRFAGWLEERRGGLVELDELVGHHLEQAAHYNQELGQPDAALATRAGERLAIAGRRALWRGDNAAAAGLLGRALELLRPARVDIALELDLASAQPTPQESAAVAEAAAQRAVAAGDPLGEALAGVAASFHRLLAGEGGVDELESLARKALPMLEDTEDHAGLVHVWAALGYGVANVRARYAEWAHAAEKALRHARLAGQRPTHLFSLDLTLVVGPTPADEALRTLDDVLPEVPHPYPLLFRSHLLAMLGRFEEAWASAGEASERLRELTAGADGGEYTLAEIATLSGDHETAANHLRGFCDFLEQHGQRGLLSTFAPMLGRSFCALGRYDEAEPQAQLGRELGEEHDVATQTLWRQVQARVESHRGRHSEAEALAREAIAMIDQTDALNFQAAALYDLAEVLIEGGRAEEAATSLGEALERYERKKNHAAAAQTRARLARLGEETLPV
jgi:class 3 adenylate cyclase/tetratricopeptide (TPR) repeat protein